MEQAPQLFGKAVRDSTDQTLIGQVYQILMEEIHSGRWKIGDRLPSISALADESGISRSPIHRAYEMLQENGILRVEDRKGAFLASLGRTELKAYGFVMLAKDFDLGQPVIPFAQLALHETLRQAAQRQAAIEVVVLNQLEDLRGVDLKDGGFFSSKVRGVMAMHPFSHPCYDPLPPERIPLVFHGGYLLDSLPVVTGDTHYGMYNLTRDAIALGHRNIALCAGKGLVWLPPIYERIRGFEAALREGSLFFDQDLFETTKKISYSDPEAMCELIRSHPQVTAWICLMPEFAQQLAVAAEAMGLSIPTDISIGGHGDEPLVPGDTVRRLSCFAPDTEQIVKNCFDLLEEQYRTRRCTQSLVLVKPRLLKGDSMGPPKALSGVRQADLVAVLD